jgi:Glycosyl hydrolase family 26/Bacterial Ig domain
MFRFPRISVTRPPSLRPRPSRSLRVGFVSFVLVAAAIAGPAASEAPAATRSISIVKPVAGATVSGTVRWKVSVRPRPLRVQFRVDGRLLRVDRTYPYVYRWDTRRVSNGRHRLSARAVWRVRTLSGAATTSLTAKRRVKVRNFPSSYYAGPAGTHNILPPRRTGAFLGIWDTGLAQAFDREETFGRRFDLLGAMYSAPRGGCYTTVPFSDGKPQAIVAHGAIPIVHYRPGFTLDEINAGQADSCFRDLGRRVRDFGHRVFLRIYHEFNGTWMVYSGCGSKFISAWRRTVSLVRGQGATNAVWIWNPGEGHRTCAFDSYPGDAWVDWVAVDGYNFARPDSWCGLTQGWCEFWQIFHHTPGVSLHDVYGPKKPFMIAETGSVEDPSMPGRKGQWFLNALASIKNDFPHLKAFMYSDFDTSASDGENWRLDTSQSSLEDFRTLARDPYFNTR